MKDALENLSKDQLSRWVHWLSNAVGMWKGDITVADIQELETMDASEIY